MKRGNFFLKLEEKPKGEVFWNKVITKPAGENRNDLDDKQYNIRPEIQNHFTKTKATTKVLNNNSKKTVYNILKDVAFYDMNHTRELKSARIKDAIKYLPNTINSIINPPVLLPAIENIEDSNEDKSDNLQGEGIEKTIIPSHILDFYSRLDVLLQLKISGQTYTLTGIF